MKIAYLIKYFHPIRGGAENYMMNLAQRAARSGHEVHVFTGDRKGNEKLSSLECEYKGMKIHRCKFWLNFTNYLFFNPSLFFKMMKQDFDIVHASGFGFIWHDFVLILKKLTSKNTKFINSPHGPFMPLGSYNFFLKIIKGIYTTVQKLFLNWLYDIVTESNTYQWQWIVNYGIDREKIKLVTPGIDREVINASISEEDVLRFKQKYELTDKFVISYLGRISKYKGVQHIIEVLPDIAAKHPDLVLLIMGRDEGYVRSLKAMAEKLKVRKNIRFIIDITEDEKYVGLNVSQIMIFPSEWEAFGIVLLEAMTQGNAIISTKTEGGNYLITDGVNGCKYDFSDIQQLKNSLMNLLEDEEMIQKMKQANKKKVKLFSWDDIYRNSYKKILDSISKVSN